MKRDKIDFEAMGVDMPALDLPRVRRWLIDVAARHGCRVGRLLYIFMNDEEILQLNRSSLGHDYYTDIITFDYTRGDLLGGEMAISLDTVRSNALLFGSDPDTELLRVVVHGLLHLTGINDKGPGEREIMEVAENDALLLYAESDTDK